MILHKNILKFRDYRVIENTLAQYFFKALHKLVNKNNSDACKKSFLSEYNIKALQIMFQKKNSIIELLHAYIWIKINHLNLTL